MSRGVGLAMPVVSLNDGESGGQEEAPATPAHRHPVQPEVQHNPGRPSSTHDLPLGITKGSSQLHSTKVTHPPGRHSRGQT